MERVCMCVHARVHIHSCACLLSEYLGAYSEELGLRLMSLFLAGRFTRRALSTEGFLKLRSVKYLGSGLV